MPYTLGVQINDPDQMWQWLSDTLPTMLRAQRYADVPAPSGNGTQGSVDNTTTSTNTNPIGERGLINDHVNRLFGHALLRQVRRVRTPVSHTCDTSSSTARANLTCINLSGASIETRTFDRGWRECDPLMSVRMVRLRYPEYAYSTAGELGVHPWVGGGDDPAE